ncbi:Diacylglycerol kinase [Candidatus Ornithobacterium hominis]|uniref:Diacylglycerol kinase n=1 Tax=Candidatus Ornithobacterium hominis TaxID=2497989 RepID=A0A383TZ59_9FLAO|nr:diacylglycerol kinase family protein [Candidatus Ornithobacterium hominis]MCT7904222.1 diacylglycerol kinase family protein [Candidatus Ornithobacterium hominis]SZD72885.1 Diacylglycerol kinase [Candidatus Ornithobacterium hominis]SZD73016.1 Diacylglycerol kinase [Candidatus Ornithobacterium hominis]
MDSRKILFVLNPASGPKDKDYKEEIEAYFSQFPEISVAYHTPNWSANASIELQKEIKQNHYDTVVASGGDGTVRFVAEILYGSSTHMGILPTGSANGLAKNLELDKGIFHALETIKENQTHRVSSLTVNGAFCIHLADIGLNASIVRRFEKQKRRGFLGYLKAFVSVSFNQTASKAVIYIDNEEYQMKFYMLVFCNATGYGTGLAINPNGKLDDNQFELVQVEKFSLMEALRLYLGKDKPSPEIVRIMPCRNLIVKTKKPVHLQVDGEYQGKTKTIKVLFNDKFIKMIVPKSFIQN